MDLEPESSVAILEKYSSFDESHPMLDDSILQNTPVKGRRIWGTAFSIILLLNCLMFVAVVMDVVYRLIASLDRGHNGYQTDLNPLMKETSHFSPLLDRFHFPFKTAGVNDTLWSRSIYAQPPSPEVDAAWEEMAILGLMYVSADDVKRMNKDPAVAVHHPNDNDKYVALPAVNHQIHCLNSLRKNLHFDYYFGPTPSALHWDHVYHCLDLILEALKCSSQTDLIMMSWIERIAIPQPDFYSTQKCRDWDTLKRWQDGNQLDMATTLQTWDKPDGVKQIPLPWQWERMQDNKTRRFA